MAEWWEGAWDNVTVTYTSMDGTESTDTFAYPQMGWLGNPEVVDPIPDYLANSFFAFKAAPIPKVIDDWWDIWGEVLYD